MANGDQGGAEPYRGANPIAAYYAGRGTPVGTGLTPEGERIARLQLIQALNDTAKLEQEIQLRGVTSWSNIAVTNTNAITNLVQASVNMARIGQLSHSKLMDVLVETEKMRGTFAPLAGNSFDESAKNLFNDGYITVRTKTRELPSLFERNKQLRKSDPNESAKLFYDAMKTEVGQALKTSMVDTSRSRMQNLERAGSPVVIVDTIDQFNRNAIDAASAAYDNYVSKLKPDDPVLGILRGRRPSGQSVKEEFVLNVVADSIKGIPEFDSRRYLNAAEKQRNNANVRLDALTKKFEQLVVGLPPELQQAVGEVIAQNRAIIEGGPEAFIERAGKAPTPVALQLNKQRLEQEIKELDDPTDRYSQAIGRYAAAVPYFENYMTVMGFNDVRKAVEYARQRPEESTEWLKIVKMMADNNELDRIDDVKMLQERMRVAGSSAQRGQAGVFRKEFLTKPIERLLGVGVNRPPLWRYFSGTNTQEQLDAAITALGQEETKGEIEKAILDQDEDDALAVEAGDLTQEEITAQKFAAGFDDKKRARLKKKAEKFRERIDPEETAKTRFEKREKKRDKGRFVLPGFEGEPVPQPEVAQVEQVPESEPKDSFNMRGFGYGSGTPLSKLIKEGFDKLYPSGGFTDDRPGDPPMPPGEGSYIIEKDPDGNKKWVKKGK